MAYESWRVYVGFNRDPNDRAAPLTDVTSFVDTVKQPIVITRGRTSERSTIQNATCVFGLTNADQRFTPGNPLSPYAPWVLSGRRVVVTDQVGDEEFPLFDGFLEFPDADDWQKSSSTAPRDQVVSVNAVDRLARLDGARTFVSTLAEHIFASASAAVLVDYYDLGRAAAPFPNVAPAGPTIAGVLAVVERVTTQALSGAISSADVLLPRGGTALPGDDLRPVRLEPSTDSFGARGRWVELAAPAVLTLASSTLTVACWLRSQDVAFDEVGWAWRLDAGDGTVLELVARQLEGAAGPVQLVASVAVPTIPSSATILADTPLDKPVLVAVRLTMPGGAVALWLDRNTPLTATMDGTPPTTMTFARLSVGDAWHGDLSHIQIYRSTGAADYTQADHVAQITAGYDGLRRQRADERITTLASYAGLPATELDLDVASALMPVARLAGRKPGPLMRVAADTDNGLLFTDGAGRVVFHSRDRRYNPTLAATVDVTWLEPPLAWRTDPPTNAMDVSSTSGAEGHAANADSFTEFTEHSAAASLDTACEADPTNLAAFTVREFGRPRQRAVTLAFELRTRTPAQRTLILRREISDRCALSGLPDRAPEGSNTLHIEGIRHTISTLGGHRVEWNTGAVLGDVPGVVQPYPRVGQAVVRDETKIPF